MNYDQWKEQPYVDAANDEAEQEEIEEELLIALGKEEPSRAHAALIKALREKADLWRERTARGSPCVDPQCPTCCNAALRCASEADAILAASTKRLGRYWQAYSEFLGDADDTEENRKEWASSQAAIEAAKPRGDGDE